MGSSLGVDPKSLLVAQYAYEFSAFCTSVIAHDSEGQIIHSRNLDFAFAGPMRNITYEAVFMRNDQELYRAIMFAGLNGVMTGHRQGFSISLNERKPSWRSNPWDLLLNIANIFLARDVETKGAVSLINVDSAPAPELLDQLRKLPHVRRVSYIRL